MIKNKTRTYIRFLVETLSPNHQCMRTTGSRCWPDPWYSGTTACFQSCFCTSPACVPAHPWEPGTRSRQTECSSVCSYSDGA